LRASHAGIFDMTVRDSNGNTLAEGDSVQVIKDLKVKGSSETLKRGTGVKNIRLTDDEEAIECGQGRNTVVLKTCFLKKA
jgi:protein PhnA